MEIIRMPEVLEERLGKEGAEWLVQMLNRVAEQSRENVIVFVEEKFERRLSEEMAKINERITVEIDKVNERITVEISRVNERITQEIAKVNQRITDETTRLEKAIHAMRADLIKWMFIFWIGQIGAILGILFAFFK